MKTRINTVSISDDELSSLWAEIQAALHDAGASSSESQNQAFATMMMLKACSIMEEVHVDEIDISSNREEGRIEILTYLYGNIMNILRYLEFFNVYQATGGETGNGMIFRCKISRVIMLEIAAL